MRIDTFNGTLPITKSYEEDGKRFIEGYASTSSGDLQGESVFPGGIDYSYFSKNGWINYDHGKKPDDIIGVPVGVRIDDKGFYVKSMLFKDREKSNEVWSLLESLKKHGVSLQEAGINRHLGYSIEGKVVQRFGGKISKCWIKNVSITPNPANNDCVIDIAKSMSNGSFKPSSSLRIEKGELIIVPELKINKYTDLLKFYHILNDDLAELVKVMEAGYATVNQEGGSSLVHEDLLGRIERLEKECGKEHSNNNDESSNKKDSIEKPIMSKSEFGDLLDKIGVNDDLKGFLMNIETLQ